MRRNAGVAFVVAATILSACADDSGGTRFRPTNFGGEISLRVSSPAPAVGIVYADAVFYSHHESRQSPFALDAFAALALDECHDLEYLTETEIVEFRDVGPIVTFTTGTASLAAPLGDNGGGVLSYSDTYEMDAAPFESAWTVTAGSAGTFANALRLPPRVNATLSGGTITFDPLGSDHVVIRIQGIDLSYVRCCPITDDGSFAIPTTILQKAPQGFLQVQAINVDLRVDDEARDLRLIGQTIMGINY